MSRHMGKGSGEDGGFGGREGRRWGIVGIVGFMGVEESGKGKAAG